MSTDQLGYKQQCSNDHLQINVYAEQIKEYTVYLRDGIKCFGDYAELFTLLENVKPTDKLNLIINSSGGRCDVGFAIAESLLAAKCRIDVTVEYPSYSMGAILALCGDSLKLAPNSFLMFHDYSSGEYGKGTEIVDSANNYQKIFQARFREICIPFLTKPECNRMFSGRDLYIHANDPTLERRIKRHFK